MADVDSANLDLKRMTEHFSKSIAGDDISVQFYCDGYKDLARFVSVS